MRKISQLLFLILLMNVFILVVRTKRAEAVDATQVSIIPERQSVSVSEPFVVNITVANVLNLFGWQVQMFYDPMILNLTDISLPSGHVFEGRNFVDLQPEIYTWSKTLHNETTVNFQNPSDSVWRSLSEKPYDPPPPPRQYTISGWQDEDGSGNLTAADNIFLDPNLPTQVDYYRVTALRQDGDRIVMEVEIAYVLWAVVLLLPSPCFNGDGPLCQLHFSGLNAGNSTLKFHSADTILLGSDLLEIPYEVHNGSVLITALGILTFDINVGGVSYSVFISSNSTISHFNFDQSLPAITFNTTGNPDTTGFCNVTIPKALLRGESWMITINDEIWAFTPTQNTSHSCLYFTYIYMSTRQVVIEGTWVIPEFPSLITIPLFMTLTLVVAIAYRKKH